MAHPDSEMKEECLREDLKFYFMNPCEKYRARHQIPWKLGLQILKIVMVTTQVIYIMSLFVCLFHYPKMEVFSHVLPLDYCSENSKIMTLLEDLLTVSDNEVLCPQVL